MMRELLVFTLFITGTLQCVISGAVVTSQNQIHNLSCVGAFLTQLDFKIGSLSEVILKQTSLCVKPECCNKHLRSLGLKVVADSLFNKESKTDFGVSIENVQFSCLDDSLGIIDKTARCERFTMDGTRWNLVSANENGTLCQPCDKGSYLVDGICQLCPRGKYTDKVGATQCLPCPAGHTTYEYNRGVCVGPHLGMAPGYRGDPTFEAKVGYESLGKQETLTGFWRSYGDWELWKSDSDDSFATILQEYTTSFRRGSKALRKKEVAAVKPTIENVFCYTGVGGDYEGYANKTASGKDCTGPNNHCVIADREQVCYCRNRNEDDTQPFCKTDDGTEEGCGIPKCNDQSDSPEENNLFCSYTKHTSVSDTPHATAGIEFSDLGRAKKICDKLGGECKGVWGKGDSWRLTGQTTSLGSGEHEFYEKSSECDSYHEYYFEQEW